MSKKSTLDKLNGFLDKTSPKLAYFLQHTWKNQQQAVTYKELRTAIEHGEFDMGYLLQWQQDYSNFIVQHYAPLAQQAIDASTQSLLARFPVLEDAMPSLVSNFIETQGGRLIREVSTSQFAAINTLVRQAALSDTMTVDHLARAIRPCIGLTTRQAISVTHVYDSLIDQGFTPQEAERKEKLYAEMVHRRRASTIAQTELAFAYNQGQQSLIEESIKDGTILPGVTKTWYTAADERVCDKCGKIDMEEVPLDETFSIGVKLPPAHPLCRCTVAYNNLQSPAPPPAAVAPAAATAAPGTAAPAPDTVEIPPDVDINGLNYQGPAHLGGTGEMHLMTDSNGEEWIFKPAQSKAGTTEQFRAYVQEAGYKVQGIVDPNSAVQVGVGEMQIPGRGKVLGAAQSKIGNLDSSFNLEDWQYYGGPLSPDVVSQLQRESVTDWLMCNYDCHGRNFVMTQDGKLIGVDKEQAFRFINRPEAQKMSYNFHPNGNIGETEPVYNTLYRRFANGQIDIRLNDTLAYIKRVEAVPDAEYRELFRKYAESLHGKGPQAEQLLDQIVARKQNLRSTFETFYSDLLSQRKGTTISFQFADTTAAAVFKSPIVSTVNPATLQGMKLKDLMALAKAKGIKSYNIMHKDELINAISDPANVQASIDSATKRYQQLLAGRKARKATRGAAQYGGVPQLSDALKDIDGTLQGSTPRGVALISDDRALEGLETNLRKVTIDGTEYYELSGKLTQTRWEQVLQNMSAAPDGYSWRWNQAIGSIDYTQPVLRLNSVTEQFDVGTKFIRNGDDIIVVAGSNADYDGRAFMGAFNIRVQANNGTDAARQIRALMSQAGMTDIADDVSSAAFDRYKKMRVIWQTSPSEAAKLNAATVTDGQIDGVLKKLGITQSRLDKIEVRKVADGYWTLYDPENIAAAKKHGVAYLYHEAGSLNAAANVLSSGELLATTNRYGRGIFASGASSFTDMETGGADSVFTRLVFKKQVGKEMRYGSFGDYVFVFEPETLERTDWFAYTSDEYGTTNSYTFNSRLGTDAHFQECEKRYHSGNELLFRKTLPLTTLKEVRVPASDVRPLIDKLHALGISHINGVRIESLIKVGSDYV